MRTARLLRLARMAQAERQQAEQQWLEARRQHEAAVWAWRRLEQERQNAALTQQQQLAEGLRALQLAQWLSYRGALTVAARSAAARRDQAATAEQRAREVLWRRHREAKVLDKLIDRQRRQALRLAGRKQQRVADELATLRFATQTFRQGEGGESL
ncbi:MAG TPA: flagellar FliJ family protein [Bacillota bacterium]